MKTIANDIINQICSSQGTILINATWNTGAPAVERFLIQHNIEFKKTQIELFEEKIIPEQIYEFIPGKGIELIKNPRLDAGKPFLSSKGFDVTFYFNDGSTLRSTPEKNVNCWNPGNCVLGHLPGTPAEKAYETWINGE